MMIRGYRRNRTVTACCLLSAVALSLSSGNASGKIDAVFFAQTHVQQPDEPYFKLTGNRDTLLKVHVVAPDAPPAPVVSAMLSLNGAQTNLVLQGPATLPASIPIEPGIVEHRFDNCFTVMIPKSWVKSGMKLTVTAGEEKKTFADLKIGAPTVVHMTMLDMHYFAYEANRDYAPGWREAIMAKWPVADLVVQRIPDTVLKELVVPPRGGLIAVRCSSPDEYKTKTGHPFDGEQATALQWQRALQRAGGQKQLGIFMINIYNVDAGGEAWDFGGVCRAGRVETLHHELGHAMCLPHWSDDPKYPYCDEMYGIPAGGPHLGPQWGFDARLGLPGAEPGRSRFISPIVQEGAPGGKPGEWKRDPMQGGMRDQDAGLMLRMFSDYSTHQMQAYFETRMALWNETLKQYVTWDDATASYSKVVENNGVNLPVVPNVEVYSIMASISALTPDANMVYQPIGPYVSGLIQLFDPSVPGDRARAAEVFAPEHGCDLSLRVTQGGKTRTYMLPASWIPGEDPALPWNFQTHAINLPVQDGKVTRAELLLTPDAEKNGLPADPKVLDVWGQK